MAEIKAKKISQLQEINSIRDSEKYLNSYLLLSYNNGPEDRDNYKIRTDRFMSYVYDDMQNKANITLLDNYATKTYLQSYYADLNDLSYCKNEVISYLYRELDVAYINEQINNISDIVDEVSENLEDFANSQYSHLEFHFTHVTATAMQDSELDRMFKDDVVILKLTPDTGYEIINSTIQVDGADYQYDENSQTLIVTNVEKNIIDVYAAAKPKTYKLIYSLDANVRPLTNFGHTPQFIVYDNVYKIELTINKGYEITYVSINNAEYWLTNNHDTNCTIWVKVSKNVPENDEIVVTVHTDESKYVQIQDSIDNVTNEIDTLIPNTAYYDVNKSHVTIFKNNKQYIPYSIKLNTGIDSFIVEPEEGYTLQDIVIRGADADINIQTGKVTVYNATDTVIKMLCVASPKQYIVIKESENASIISDFPTGVYTDTVYTASISTPQKYKVGNVSVTNVDWYIWNDSRIVFQPNGKGVVKISVTGVRDNAWSATPIDDRINELVRNVEDLQRQIDYYHADSAQVMWYVDNVVLSERPTHIGDKSYEIKITPELGYSLPQSIEVSGINQKDWDYILGEEYAMLYITGISSSLVTIKIYGVPNIIPIIYEPTAFTYVNKPESVLMGNPVSFTLRYSNLRFKDPICEDDNKTARNGAIVNANLINVIVNESRNIVTATYEIQPTGDSPIYINPVEESLILYHFGIVSDESLFVMQEGTERDGQVMEYPVKLRDDVDLSTIPQFVTTNGYNPFAEVTYKTYFETTRNNYKYMIVPQEFVSIEDEIYLKHNTTKYKIVFDPYKGYNDHGVPQPNGNSKWPFDPDTNIDGYVYNIGNINNIAYYAIYFDLTDSDIETDFALTIISE